MIPIGILTAAATSSFSYLLDLYPGAAAAYSIRKLRAGYTGNAIRVRRSSDNIETDIGFLNNVLNTTALLTFCGVGNGFVTKWYDQSGNANDAVQAVVSSQPSIVILGVLITENSKPTISFGGVLPLTTALSSNTNISMFAAQRTKTATSWGFVFAHNSGGGSGPAFGINNTNKINLGIALNGVSKNGSSLVNAGTTFSILNTIVNSVNVYTYLNNLLIPITLNNWSPSTTNFTQMGQYFNLPPDLNISEAIIYKTDQFSNSALITNNINSFFTIF